MRKLLNSLYILTPTFYLRKNGENVVVADKGKEVARFPLHTLESICCFTYEGASPSLMGACVEQGIGLYFFTPSGKFLACAAGTENGNVLLRRQQYHIAEDEKQSIRYSRNMIAGKVFNEKWVLERTIRNHSLRMQSDAIKKTSQNLSVQLHSIRVCESLDTLRGLEGDCAQDYFRVFGQMILQQETDFQFSGRNRRPPMDRVNALLSFAYTMLTNDCRSALRSVGLDPYIGFMHATRPGRTSLALDLMEELRAPLADRVVLTGINEKIITASDFTVAENGAILLSDAGRKKFLSMWQRKKQEELTHPFLMEKLSWGLVPYVQALLLARTIRGDLDEYPPFMWK